MIEEPRVEPIFYDLGFDVDIGNALFQTPKLIIFIKVIH